MQHTVEDQLLAKLNAANLVLTNVQAQIVSAINLLTEAKNKAAEVTNAPAAGVSSAPVASRGPVEQSTGFLIAGDVVQPQAEITPDTHPALRESTLLIEQAMTVPTPHHAEPVGEEVVDTEPATDNDGPTPEAAPTPPRDPLLEMRKNFRGTGSIFARTLSPDSCFCGKGFIKPTIDGSTKIYNDDITMITPERLAKWPTGFYRNKDTKALQFFVRTDTVMVFIDNVQEEGAEPVFLFLPLTSEPRKYAVDEIPLEVLVSALAPLEMKLLEVAELPNLGKHVA